MKLSPRIGYCQVWLPTLLCLVCTISVRGEERAKPAATFRNKLVLFGACTIDEPDDVLIQTLLPDGTDQRTVAALGKIKKIGTVDGRISPDGRRLAYSSSMAEGEDVALWMMEGDAKPEKLAPRAGWVTAWSPNAAQVTYFRTAAKKRDRQSYESYAFELAPREEFRLDLADGYLIDDWHPREAAHTVMFQNSRNRFFCPLNGDWYPVRQLDVLRGETLTSLTHDPSSDNIQSRFSPEGDRVAHYCRRFKEGRPMEYLTVCGPDGSDTRDVFAFTEFGDREGLAEFRPHNDSCWSPNGEWIATLVTTRKMKDQPKFDFELVVIPLKPDAKLKRIPCVDLGLRWVQGIDWK